MSQERVVSVIGLGYVGLPVAVAFAKAGVAVVGFDINEARIAELRSGRDQTGEVDAEELAAVSIDFTSDPAMLAKANFHIVTVPTPVTEQRQPDLSPLVAASRTVGRALKAGDIVVYESTVYPGATEEDCIPVLEAESGLAFGKDFTVGYSPERINPGDREHRFENIAKIVSGSDPATLDIVTEMYAKAVRAPLHRAPSLKVAEAAKVIENTQRDLNIALMNELALIFERLGIRTADVLAAAGTKWNFLPFSPGLVGGHCIGVDPYYLTSKAERLGYHPQVVLSGRRINDGMGAFIVGKLVKMLVHADRPVRNAKVGVLGLTFKENVPDLRNSKVPDIVRELKDFGISPIIHDIMADREEAMHEYGIHLSDWEEFRECDAIILAVPHKAYVGKGAAALLSLLKRDCGLFVDVKSTFSPDDFPGTVGYWSL